MSLVHELAASVQCCFELFAVQTDGVLLSRTDQAQLSEISSILQPVLMKLQKHAVTITETQELYAEDEQLLSAVVHLRRALEKLQAASGRCSTPHWLMRVLLAADVRDGLQSALRDTADALGELLEADGAADAGPLQEVCQLQQTLVQHKVSPHEPLERLSSGLYRHMEQATDAEQVVAMLRFVVREAQNLSLRRKQSSSRQSSSSDSRRDSDASDASNSKAAPADAANNSSGAAAAAASSTSSMDTSSDSSSGSRKNNTGGSSKAGGGSSSKSGKPVDLPPGESSLTDVQLLLAVQQLADSKTGTQQLVLHQVLSILEELHEQKAHQLKHKQMRRLAAAGAGAGGAHGGHLSSVPEGADDGGGMLMSIAAVRQPSDLASNGHHHQAPAAAAAAARLGGAAAAPTHNNTSAAAAAAAAAGGRPTTYSDAVAAMAGGLEALLWADPWDTAALTQLLELLHQAAAEDEFVEPEAEQYVSGNDGEHDDTGRRDQDGRRRGAKKGSGKGAGGGGGGRTWWGSVGKAAKAALRSAGNTPSGGGGGKAGGRAAADEAAQLAAQQKRERLHKLVVAGVDVLLRLTAQPGGTDSCFGPAARPDLTPYRSIALPLMAHCDTAPALAACIWSSWNDAAIRAARVLTMLLQSEPEATPGSPDVAAATGLASSPAAIYANFCHNVVSSGGVSGSAWHGLVTLLHNGNMSVAAAAAEALAAVGHSSKSGELCTSLAATQAARALLLLLAKHQVHPAAAGAAAAALHGLGNAHARPAMHELLVGSYTSGIPGASVPLGDSLVAIMLGNDSLAACRAASLAASLAPGVPWAAAVTHTGGEPGSLWAETFRAGQHLLQRGRSSSGVAAPPDASMPSVAGARLLRRLVQAGCKRPGRGGARKEELPPGQGGADADISRTREDMCFEALLLCVQKLQGYDIVGSKGALAGKEGRATALLELMHAVLGAMSEGRVCGVLPDLFGSVVPMLEAIQRNGGSSSGSSSLQRAASQMHEQLMVLGG